MQNTKDLPVPAIRRLPLYLSFLKSYEKNDTNHISAPEIAKELHIDSTQITKDFSYLNVKGKTKIGYETNTLISVIEDYLGYHRLRKAFIVGVGSLGVALIKYGEFHDEGMDIIAGFDIDTGIVENNNFDLELFHINKLKERFDKTPVDIGIIAVPAIQAQKIADKMIGCGIKAIWNFSPTPLSAPDNIIVENTSIDSSLAMIKWRLNRNKPLLHKNRIL